MPKPKTVFTLGGKPLNLNSAGGSLKAIPRHLDRLARGTLLTTKELSLAVGLSSSAVLQTAAKLQDYCIRFANARLWGSKQTIRDAEAELGDNR